MVKSVAARPALGGRPCPAGHGVSFEDYDIPELRTVGRPPVMMLTATGTRHRVHVGLPETDDLIP